MGIKRLTEAAESDRACFDSDYADYGCSCHLRAPCGYCVHPGNPVNQEENPDCWEELPDIEDYREIEARREDEFRIAERHAFPLVHADVTLEGTIFQHKGWYITGRGQMPIEVGLPPVVVDVAIASEECTIEVGIAEPDPIEEMWKRHRSGR